MSLDSLWMSLARILSLFTLYNESCFLPTPEQQLLTAAGSIWMEAIAWKVTMCKKGLFLFYICDP